ncbi:hypothetical protein B9T31_06540 [Acinetobacter sp. ANC 4558]|uniref:DUF2339 domain-containing protein n=1 Tax=Acinetobacter sp. ANC 4558 TaxID=1977876 RepID=UPI000A349C23|nr:DUF2339 domain-containing protein [Acinetobacter sp. ANC 4558]OTG86660.1 hypothetical protein B9T31_06540 [Acinetobacter sp. ANC 4558]
MHKINHEIRIIWLMSLIIIGVGAWFYDLNIMVYVCGIIFIVSIMQYVNGYSQQIEQFGQQRSLTSSATHFKIPLYIISIVIVISAILDWMYLVALAIIFWVYYLLRWLQFLELSITNLQEQIQKKLNAEESAKNISTHNEIQQNISMAVEAQHISSNIDAVIPDKNNFSETSTMNTVSKLETASSLVKNSSLQISLPLEENRNHQDSSSIGFVEQVQAWIFQGNPVLKVAIAILFIGVVLLLRFATEHWQFSLIAKLSFIALMSLSVVGLGVWLQGRNRSFSLALEGLGLAGLFLTLFFAHYNQIIPALYAASFIFIVIMALTLYLSLKQQSVELAIMAMVVAYLAPITLPENVATAVEFLTYYFVINLAVAILSSLRPWKFLNQIAFMMTIILGGGYVFMHGNVLQKPYLAGLILAHTAVFVWLGFRFSQLLAKEDLIKIQLKPILDIALIFGAPTVGYFALYILYFNEMYIKAGFSLAFATVFAVLYQLARKNRSIPFIAQSYLSLMQIFLVLIPPILLPEYWSIAGWSVVGLTIFVYSLYQNSKVSRYLAMALLLIAGFSALQYFIDYHGDIPNTVFWILVASYLASVFIVNVDLRFRQQVDALLIVFLSFLMIVSTSILLVLFADIFTEPLTQIYTLFASLLILVAMNEILQRRNIDWEWLLPKWVGLTPIHLFAYILVYSRTTEGALHWISDYERVLVLGAGLLLTSLWLRPLLGVKTEKEWVSLGTLSGLSLASLSLIPSFPYLSMVILPLSFCLWCFWRNENPAWAFFWQARTTLALMVIWIICSQLFATQVFQYYWLPVFNPFDLMSIGMLVGLMWMLSLQVKSGLDQGLASVMAVLGLLWLSSYILLRALHQYLGTPLNQIEVWSNATIQLSFTLLWVILAFIAMSVASRKCLKPLWILGGSILIIVTLKLVLLDLSHIGTLTRVISFLGAGFIMLIIAYIAPIPTSSPQEITPEK